MDTKSTIRKKLKIFIVLFASSSIVCYLFRSYLVSWPSILVTTGAVSAVMALLDDQTAKLAKGMMGWIFKNPRNNKSST
jgi:hypothetical protein